MVFSAFAAASKTWVQCLVRMDWHVYSPIPRWSLSMLAWHSSSTVGEDTSYPDRSVGNANNWLGLGRTHCAIDCSWFRRPAAMHRLRCSRVELRERRCLDAVLDVCRTPVRNRRDDNRERTRWIRRRTSSWFVFHVAMNVTPTLHWYSLVR